MARLEAIRIFLAFASYKKLKVYQIDVKSTFPSGNLEEEDYIEQPEGFQLTDKIDYVCILKKQAPRAWYERIESNLQV